MKKTESEKLPFSRVDQIGVIVRDMEQAVAYYESLGIGPFVTRKKADIVTREAFGKPAGDVKLITKIAQMGDLELELIQPVYGNSTGKKSLETRGEGISHLGFFVDDIDSEIDKMVKRGFKVISRVKRVDGAGSAYFDTDKVGGVQFELLQRKK